MTGMPFITESYGLAGGDDADHAFPARIDDYELHAFTNRANVDKTIFSVLLAPVEDGQH